MADLLEQLQQLKDEFASLKNTTPQSTPTEELSQLTDKLEHLTMGLQAASAQGGTSAQNHAGIHRHPVCNTERIQSHYNHAPKISTHLMGKTAQS